MREFIATPFMMVSSLMDWITVMITGQVVVKLHLDPETAEEFLSQFED